MEHKPGLECDEMVHEQVISLLSLAEMVGQLQICPSVFVSCGSQLCELIPNYHDLQENLSPEWDGACGRIKAQTRQAVSWVTSFWPVLFYCPAAVGSSRLFDSISLAWSYLDISSLICFSFDFYNFRFWMHYFKLHVCLCVHYTHIHTCIMQHSITNFSSFQIIQSQFW